MAWNTPMTAVAGSVFTAAQFNTFVRDNLNSTAPALATASGQTFVATGVNAIAARSANQSVVNTAEGTTSATYAALTTAGPSVTAVTGTSAWVNLFCASSNSGTVSSLMSFAVSGASSIAASDLSAVGGAFGTNGGRCGISYLQTGLTPGSNTFTAQYRVGSGTGTYSGRILSVNPL